MSRLAIEWRPVEDVTPYPGNPRKISDAAVDKTAASINEFGWRQPIVVDVDGVIIAGHTRLLAAKKLGHTEVPVHVADGLTPDQVRAYRLADNRSGEEADWDWDQLAGEMLALAEADFDLALTAFDDAEIDKFLALADATEDTEREEETPEPPEDPVSQPGDVWVCGRHRVRCGDSTVATDVEALLGDVKPHLMVTDPPYGVKYDAEWRKNAGLQKAGAHGRVSNDDRADWREAWALFPGDVAYVWHGALHAGEVAESLSAAGFKVRAQIIWAKVSMVIGRGDYHWQHEPCWYVVKDKAKGHWQGDRTQTTVWTIEHRRSETGHSTQKPVEAMRRPIVNNSSPGQAVYDPFAGSGTTLIAAESTGRACLGMELDPAYVDVIVRRWEEFTGKHATLEADGKSFAEVTDVRQSSCRGGPGEGAGEVEGDLCPSGGDGGDIATGRAAKGKGKPRAKAGV